MNITNEFDEEYKRLVNTVLSKGVQKDDRTGVGTISYFAPGQFEYDLSRGHFPLLTTKKVNFDFVVRELLWFLSGSTNIEDLGPAKVLWESWADVDGNLGPVYGAQWRAWRTCTEDWVDYVDQIDVLVKSLKATPDSRRHCVSAWNVGDLGGMALPPCHSFWQVYVNKDRSLDLHLYQRSADLAVGVPFNVASYSLLLIMLANECGYTPGRFVHSFGDAHVYTNHVENLTKQVLRKSHPAPTIAVIPGLPVLQTKLRDISLVNYYSEPFIKYELAV